MTTRTILVISTVARVILAEQPTQAPVLQADACITSNQCLNGGICKPANDGEDSMSFRHCHCPDHFTGFRCENYCPLQCQNDGVCQHIGNSNQIQTYIHSSNTRNDALHSSSNKNQYTCKCKGYFTGPLCQTPYVNCHQGGHQCYNGAQCGTSKDGSIVSSTTLCICTSGYAGDHCQVKLEAPLLTKQASAGVGVGSILAALLLASTIALVVRRQQRRKRLMQSLSPDESQNLHTSMPREEREDWECRNII